MLERGIFGRSVQIFLTQPVEFTIAGIVAMTACILSAGILIGPALAGIVAMALRRSAGETVGIPDMLKGFERFTATIPIGLAVMAMVLVGSALLLVPGLLLGATYFMALPVCIDRDLSSGASMAEARRLALRELLPTVIIFTAALALGLAGLVLLIVGLCLTVPLATIALTLAYREASRESPREAVQSAG
jgi:uncharacterized membrane protein